MDNGSVLVTIDEQIAIITINRPQVFNALNAEVLNSLAAAVSELSDGGQVRAIIITGEGTKAFSAGADLDELAGLNSTQAYETLHAGQRTMSSIESSSVPVIAAVNGLALGGGFELVLASTFAVLSEKAAFALPESGLGLIPGYGGTQRLPLLIGKSVAAYLMLTGERLNAQRAFELGLSPVAPVAPEDLMSMATQIARQIAAKGPKANAAILQALGSSAATEQGLGLETGLAALAVAGTESDEGVAAFKERRQPQFSINSQDEVNV